LLIIALLELFDQPLLVLDLLFKLRCLLLVLVQEVLLAVLELERDLFLSFV